VPSDSLGRRSGIRPERRGVRAANAWRSFKAAEAEAEVQYRTADGAMESYEDLVKVSGLNAKLREEQRQNLLY